MDPAEEAPGDGLPGAAWDEAVAEEDDVDAVVEAAEVGFCPCGMLDAANGSWAVGGAVGGGGGSGGLV